MNNTKYFICVTSKKNYDTCLNKGLWGVEERYKDIIQKAVPEDIIIFYIKVMQNFGIICKVVSNMFPDWNTKIWDDGLYPYRIKIEPLFQYQKHVDRQIINRLNLEFLPNKVWWAKPLHTSMLQINKDDYSKILNYIKVSNIN